MTGTNFFFCKEVRKANTERTSSVDQHLPPCSKSDDSSCFDASSVFLDGHKIKRNVLYYLLNLNWTWSCRLLDEILFPFYRTEKLMLSRIRNLFKVIQQMVRAWI